MAKQCQDELLIVATIDKNYNEKVAIKCCIMEVWLSGEAAVEEFFKKHLWKAQGKL